MTSLYMTSSTTRPDAPSVSSRSSRRSSKDANKHEVPPPSAPTPNINNNSPLAITTSIGSTIQRHFERLTSIIDESLESDSLLPSLCNAPNSNKHNDTSFASSTTVDTSMNTSGDTSYFQGGEETFIMSPISNIRNECNLHFATWLQSKEFDASGIVSQEEEEEDGHLQQYSRDEFLNDVTQDEYVSISEQQKKRGVNHRKKFPWVVSDVWDSIVSSNWKCWRQQEEQQKQQQPQQQPKPFLGMAPPPPISPFTMDLSPLPLQQQNTIKDSSYVVDALASEILPPLNVSRTGSKDVEVGNNDFGTTESSSVDKSSKDTDVKVDNPSTSTSLIHHLNIEPSCGNAAPQQPQEGQQPTTIPTAASNTSVDIPTIVKKGTIGEFIWQEDSQRPNTTTSPPSLALSSLAGEDITMTSNHSCTYSVSPIRAADIRGNSSRSSIEVGGAVAALLALDNLAQPPPPPPTEEGTPQSSTSPNTSTMSTKAAILSSVEDFDDSFPAVVQLPPEDNEEEEDVEREDEKNNSCHTPLMDTSVLNSSDGGGGDEGDGSGPSKTKETMSKLRLKWAKGKNRHRSTK
ncbi:hypothetical protein ACHAWU_007699 [Discostella pseudostelligera]|uniref:Uncharacterized protein n=1 Tax=Discostella pseudostelligera TaxID=259834 RepID=A0ABD3M0S3_9STRA